MEGNKINFNKNHNNNLEIQQELIFNTKSDALEKIINQGLEIVSLQQIPYIKDDTNALNFHFMCKKSSVLNTENFNQLKDIKINNYNSKSENKFFDESEIININIGDIGCNIGIEFWSKLVTEIGLPFSNSNSQTKDCEDKYNVFFFLEKSNIYRPRTILINTQDSCLSLPSAKKIIEHFDCSNYSLLFNGFLADSLEGNFQEKELKLKDLIQNGIRVQLEKCNTFQGFLLIFSAGERFAASLRKLFHEVNYEFNAKGRVIDVPIFSLNNPLKSPNVIFNETYSLYNSIKYSNLILHFIINFLTEGVNSPEFDLNSVKNQSENQIVANILAFLTYPLRKKFYHSISIKEFLSTLIDNENRKIISSNMFPLYNESLNFYDEETITNYCLFKEDLTFNNSYNHPITKSMIISDGVLSQNGYAKINKYINEKNKNLKYFNQDSSQIQLINCGSEQLQEGKIRKMLFLSNNFTILEFLKILNSKFNAIKI